MRDIATGGASDSGRESAEATAIRECRLHFLRAASEHPKVKLGESLRRMVFEPRMKLWAELGLPDEPCGAWTPEQDEALPVFNECEAKLISGWAAKHRLDYEWVHRAAMEEVCWDSFPKRYFAEIPGYQPPDFIWTAWYFQHQSERQYRHRIETAFQKKLDEYVSRVKRRRLQFLADRESQGDHYRWSVEHVCLGWRWIEIAREDPRGRSWQAVAKAVGPILDRIELPRHNNLRGSKKRLSRLSTRQP